MPNIRVEHLTEFSQGRYLTYPHANGFADDCGALVLGEMGPASYSLIRVENQSEWKIAEVPIEQVPTAPLWFDIAGNLLVFFAGGGLWILDLNCSTGKPERIYQAEPDVRLADSPGISSDGTRVLVGTCQGGAYRCQEVETPSGKVLRDNAYPWFANHFHYSPADNDWVVYCHEGDAAKVSDRTWARHPVIAPRGRCVFDQEKEGGFLYVGHERACAHAPGLLAVAFGASPVDPCGLYYVDFSESSATLISESTRDWHCSSSNDGLLAVVDTTGPHDRIGRGWQDADHISDILLVDMKTGERTFLARTLNGGRHPLHPHPVFSPDGKWIYFNETSNDRRLGRVVRISLSDL